MAWTEWLERSATEGPSFLRPLFEAEIAFEAWAGDLIRRARPHVRAGAHVARTRAFLVAVWAMLALVAAAAWAVEHTVVLARRMRVAWRQLVDAADRADRRWSHRLPAALSRHDQRRLAETLLGTAMVLAVLGAAAASNLHPSTRGFTVDRLASGKPAGTEALAARPDVPAAPATPAGAEAGAAPAAPAAAAGSATATPSAPPPPAIPAQRGPIPVGKGMWIYVPERAEGGNPDAIVARAVATGLTHLYVRTGSLKGGFIGGPLLDQLLPRAHAAGLRVYAWDFPYLNDVAGDVTRAVTAIRYLTPDGHRVDGYAADIELRNMGVNVNPETATAFGSTLRRIVGPHFPLIATVPRPSPALVTYPFAEVVASFDAVAPMVYWLGRDPAADVIATIQALAPLGKPIIPVGQAYDGSREGGPVGVPPRDQLMAFMKAAEEHGAVGVSWWSWQHADQQAWDAVRDAPHFTLPAAPAPLSEWQVRAYQTLLSTLGFGTPITGVWDESTANAVGAYQAAARLPQTRAIDAATRGILFTPFAPPLLP